MAKSVNILGLDPGFASMGYAVVALAGDRAEVMRCTDGKFLMGTIKTEKSNKKRSVKASDDNLRRGREIYEALAFLMGSKPVSHPAFPFQLGGYSLDIQAICAESMSFPRNSSSAQKVGISWGIISSIAASFNVPVIQASPQEIKKQVCGKKNASKEEIQTALSEQFEVSPETFNKTTREHPFDALGAVVACRDSEVIRMALKMAAA